MHERSLVRSLLEQARQAILPALPESVRTIRMAIGPLAGVEPLLVREAFSDLRHEAGWPQAELQIDETPLTARCQACQYSFEIMQFKFECPMCQSRKVDVVSGDECRLISVDLIDENWTDE